MAQVSTLVGVHVKPGASRNRIVLLPQRNERGQLQLEIRLQARAHDGQANAALIKLLAKSLGLPQSGVALVQGSHSRTKLLQLECDEMTIHNQLGG